MFQYFYVMVFILIFTSCSSEDKLPVQVVNSQELLSNKNANVILNQKKSDVHTYFMGFDLRGEPQEDIKEYLSLLQYLKQKTGLSLKLYITPKDSSSEKELCLNHTQFAIVGALSFLKAHVACGADVLVRGLNYEHKTTYQSMFITKLDSKINSIDDLRGVDFAFGNINSTQGHLIPKQELKEHNISLKDFKTYMFTGSHQKCAESVLSGNYDVCALQDTLAKDLVKRKLVKIIHKSSQYPSSLIAVNTTIPEEIRTKIRQALINFDPTGKDKKGLYHWENTEMPFGFTEGVFADYKHLHDVALEFGMLKKHTVDQK